MKITSKIAKSNLLKGINATADGFKPIHAKISTGLSQCGIQAKDITITQGKAILTKEELELKRQQESGYIKTDDQHELWKIQENVCKYLNELEVFASKKPGLRSIFRDGYPDNLDDYILWEKDPKIAEIPATGGMIYKPDPNAIKDLESKNKFESYR
ncbi:unnamed protein product, partial [marine sediment metagenome]